MTYRTLLQKKEESEISANLEKRQIGETFRILDPARLPERPISPDRPQLYLIAILGALALGIGLATAAEYLDRTLRSEADVRAALNLMVLATVPNMRDGAAVARRLRRRLVFSAAGTAVIAVCAAVAWRLLS
jgi:capsular polysaccharide biosynthesis protein